MHGARLLRDVAGAVDDTVAFGTAEYAQSSDAPPLVVTLWAATAAGFATVRITTNPDPRSSNNMAGVTVLVEAWQRLPVLRLGGVSPLEERLALTLTVGSTSITSTKGDEQELIALYRACADFLRA
jgi:hypothetical protein